MGPITQNSSRVSVVAVLALLSWSMVILEGSLWNSAGAEFGVEVAPDFDLTSFEGEYFSNYDFKGEQALLMFWAPWCGVCRQELPKLSRFYLEELPPGLTMIAIGTSAPLGQVEQYVNNHPATFTYPTAYDANKAIADDFRIRAFPTFVLIDRDGTIALVHRGGGILDNPEFHELVN